jgi:hypothetical protein
MLVLALLLFAAIPPGSKPPCNKHLRGHLWPEEANTDRKLALEMYRQGDLEMCTIFRSRYGWRALSVNAKRLQANITSAVSAK